MPYIVQDRRPVIDTAIAALPANLTDGEMNYAITRILSNHLVEVGISYSVLNKLVGVVTCVKDEFYRRVVAPYEDKKIAVNGDVFPLHLTGK